MLVTGERRQEVDLPSPPSTTSVPGMGWPSTYTMAANLHTQQRHPGQWAHVCRAARAAATATWRSMGKAGSGWAHLRVGPTVVDPSAECRSVRALRAVLGDALPRNGRVGRAQAAPPPPPGFRDF